MKHKQILLILFTLICLGSSAACSGASTGLTKQAGKGTNGLLPAAVLVNPYDGTNLTLISPQQENLGSIPIENADGLEAGSVIPAGQYATNKADIPLLFTTYDQEVTINLAQSGQTQMLRSFNALGKLAGSNGKPIIAFSEVVFSDNSLKSFLYVGDTGEVGFSTSVYEYTDYLNQWVLAPLAVDVAEGLPNGVWYTTSGWGVGGPGLFFPITQGLYYYEVDTGNVTDYLDSSESLQGFSPDQQLAGSIPSSSYGDHPLTVTNLFNHWTLTFPLKATSDKGAGYAVFSPDDLHAAWLEVGESPYGNYEYDLIVRIGNLENGQVELEIDESAAMQALGVNAIDGLQPIGWLDNDTLLIQVRGLDWQNAAILQMRVSERKLTQFSRGAFIAFIY